MTPFTYAAADGSAAAVRFDWRAQAGAKLPRRRHQPGRPDARERRAADALVDVTGLSASIDRDARTAA